MKRLNKLLLILSIAVLIVSTGCQKEKAINRLEQDMNTELPDIMPEFDFNSSTDYSISINTKSVIGEVFKNVPVSIYKENPYSINDAGLLVFEGNSKISTFTTSTVGSYNAELTLPSYLESVYVVSDYIGVPQIMELKLDNESLVLDYQLTKSDETESNQVTKKSTSVTSSHILGDWNYKGVPYYLEDEDDNLTQDFIDDVNASLPERVPLTESHPRYFDSYTETNLVIEEDAEVWITFVWEGAGYRNTLGYYFYPTNTPPASPGDIEQHIIFPNVSFPWDGGLSSGNKVQLMYKDPTTGEVTNRFPAGTTISYYIRANAWVSSLQDVNAGIDIFYSNYEWNIEEDEDNRRHNVLLYDAERELVLIGFEDLNREAHSDDDFNDAIFYASISPFTAIDPKKYSPIDTPEDADEDGISDLFDEYPEDPDRAFNNYYPAEGVNGSLVYEDLWPARGDYDFNDMVVDYNYKIVTNASNKVIDVKAKFTLRAMGAAYDNGFAFELDVDPSDIESISGQDLQQGYLNVSGNGTESGNSSAIIPVFENGKDILEVPSSGWTYNTEIINPKVPEVELSIDVLFANKIYSIEELGDKPFNPFILINKSREHEVHLMNYSPTSSADASLFGTKDDATNEFLNRTYIGRYFIGSEMYFAYPWALDIPESFDYPIEKASIKDAYVFFDAWAKSNGTDYTNWYKDESGNRNESLIYK